MTTIQLTVPDLDQAINPTTITNLRELQQWVDELPYANMQIVAEQTYKALFLLNRYPRSVNNRAKLMGCYLTPFKHIADTLRSALRQQPSANHSAYNEYRILFEKITVEMAYGFKKVINETEQHGSKKRNSLAQTQAFYYAMHCLALQLMLSFTGYILEPRIAWMEIVQLLRHAEERSFSQRVIKNLLHDDEPETDILNEFKRIALLLILDPFRLERGEIWLAYDYLAHWSSQAKIAPMHNHPKQDTGLFFIDMKGIQKPQIYSVEKPPTTSNNYLVLNCLSLNTAINNQLKILKENQPTHIPGTDGILTKALTEMLRHMLLAWHICPERRHSREEQYDWLRICCGINSVNHFLTLGSITPSEMGTDNASQNTDKHRQVSSTGNKSNQAHLIHRWRQTNISSSGMGVLIPPDDQMHIQVGQLILLESERDTNRGKQSVGVVRRLIRHDNETLEAGIQFIQGTLSPAQIKNVTFDNQINALFQPALQLDRGENYPPAVFTHQMFYQPNREYEIETSKREKLRVFSGALLETTRCYERFEYRLISLQS